MRLTVWELLRLLYRNKGKLLAVPVLAAVLAWVWVDRVQTYSAEVILRFPDASAAQGMNPDGTPFDVWELAAPEVLARASEQLPLPLAGSQVQANITITPVTVDGEGTSNSPTVFWVTYRGNGSLSETRDTLDQLVSSYAQYYCETHVGLAALHAVDGDLNQQDLDYLEQAELLQANLDQTLQVLRDCAEVEDYLSPVNGLSAQDLIDWASQLSQFRLSQIYANIYAARLSKDPVRLIDRYTERQEQHELNANNASRRAQLTGARLEAYAGASQGVESSLPEGSAYGALLESYVADRILASHESLDAQRCGEIAALFATPAREEVDAARCQQAVEEDIAQALSELAVLYDDASVWVEGWNARVPQRYLECLSGVRTAPDTAKAPCVLLAAASGFVLACMGVLAYASMRSQEQEGV